MQWSQIAEIVVNESDNMIYLSDVDTYELIYLNAEAKKLFGIKKGDDSYIGRKCYEVLQGMEGPCEFCNNAILNNKSFYTWEYFNSMVKEHFAVKDKLVTLGNRCCRLEIANVATTSVRKRLEMERQLEKEKTLIACITTLVEGTEIKASIDSLLKIVANFYEGDRAYIIEIDWSSNTCSNTYEWVQEGITREIDNLQNLPLKIVDTWLKKFSLEGKFYITNLEENVNPNSSEYKVLRAQNIQSLIACPLVTGGEVAGFLGIDNPRKNYTDLTLLTSVSYFLQNDLEKRRTNELLERMSYEDSLTGLYNRHKYNQVVHMLEEERPRNMGIVYMDLNGLKFVNDSQGHLAGDRLIAGTARKLIEVFKEDVFRIGGDEFVAICRDISEDSFSEKLRKLHLLMKEAHISISTGSCWQAEYGDIREQLMQADRDMYMEKQEYYKREKGKPNNDKEDKTEN